MISLKTFSGEVPRTLPHLLPDNAAQLARDCDFAAGSLMGLRKNAPVANISAAIKSLYVHDNGMNKLYTWPDDVIALRGTIANDAYSRFYWLSGGILYVSQATGVYDTPTPDNSYKVGVPFSDTAPQLTSTAGTSTVILRRVYVHTYVNEFGEEGAPSPPLEVDVGEGGTVNFTVNGHPNNAGYCPIKKVRVYRAETGTSGTSLLFLNEYDNASSIAISDSAAATALGEPLSTKDFYPPDSWLENIIALPNGVFAASKGNEICFCQQYLPYAWRPDDVLTTATPVIGMCAAEGGMYVTTKTNPYFISGVTPDAMSPTKITAIQAGVSRKSICNLGQTVIYASHDGLVSARGVTVDMDYSMQLFTREEWRDRYADKLSKLHLDAHDGNLLGWFDDGTPGFLLRFDGEALSFTELSDSYFASFVYPLGDSLYLSAATVVVEFKGTKSRKAFDWWSKDFIQTKQVAFSAALVRGKGRVIARVYGDGTLLWTEDVTLRNPTDNYVFRIPSGEMFLTWSIRLTGDDDACVYEFDLAGSPSEFANV